MVEEPIWVLKYDMYLKDGGFVEADTPGATKSTDCHAWYEHEEDALTVQRALGRDKNGNLRYKIEKVYKRVLNKNIRIDSNGKICNYNCGCTIGECEFPV